MVRPAGRLRSATARLAGGFRLARLPALAAVLVLVERALVGEVGSPTTLLRALPGYGDAWGRLFVFAARKDLGDTLDRSIQREIDRALPPNLPSPLGGAC